MKQDITKTDIPLVGLRWILCVTYNYYYTTTGSYIESGFHHFSKVASPSYSTKLSIIIRTAGSYIKSESPIQVKSRKPFSINRNSPVIRTSGSYIKMAPGSVPEVSGVCI